MNQLAEIQIENKEDFGLVVSSRVVAEQIGKRHGDVINQIRRILTDDNVRSLIIDNEYRDKKGELRTEYLLTKDGFTLYMFNIQGHNDFKMNYINKFNEMEDHIKNQTLKLPTTYKEALLELVAKEEENERLRLETEISRQRISEMKPKASYYDNILQNKSLVTIGQIAKDYGMSAQALNKLLHDLKVQYKQSGQWLLYSKHHSKGLTHSDTTEIEHKDGSTSVRMHTKWTQNGRLFLYELLKQNNILPMIEQEVS
ncbi:phage regulatory protein/antirepressor Ant [Jeotgalicoccus psychrophilus]|uniref:phage regulatory protein/antirepressor Ant n=1 Tax=Jeotgalicoccus psychrophilus TaxID=157228 RepID=UPI00041C56AD|nr:phage regulatory protein/antirepressor Ant [Jeotgalicoccus psychrophilus]